MQFLRHIDINVIFDTQLNYTINYKYDLDRNQIVQQQGLCTLS
mgnify:CR=1 FL=1